MRGHIQELGKDKFRLFISLGPDPAKPGRYKRLTKVVHGTKAQAQKALTELLHELNVGELADPGRMTFGDLLDRWVRDCPLADRTREWARGIIETHLKPALGRVPLAKLSPLDIQGYLTNARRRDGRDGPLAPGTLHGHYRLIHAALARAVEWRLLGRNPADGVKPPKKPETPGRALSIEELGRLLAAARPYRYYALYLAAIATGMRSAELLGLRWQDVDLGAGLIHVRRALRRPGRRPEFAELKTRRSRRTLRIPPELAAALRERHAEYEREREFFGPRYTDRDLVWATIYGNPIGRTDVDRRLKHILERAQVPHVRFHDLRHSHATYLLLAGVDFKTVQEQLGHAQGSTTVDIYAHVLAAMQGRTATAITEVLAAARADDEGDKKGQS